MDRRNRFGVTILLGALDEVPAEQLDEVKRSVEEDCRNKARDAGFEPFGVASWETDDEGRTMVVYDCRSKQEVTP